LLCSSGKPTLSIAALCALIQDTFHPSNIISLCCFPLNLFCARWLLPALNLPESLCSQVRNARRPGSLSLLASKAALTPETAKCQWGSLMVPLLLVGGIQGIIICLSEMPREIGLRLGLCLGWHPACFFPHFTASPGNISLVNHTGILVLESVSGAVWNKPTAPKMGLNSFMSYE
jgi:hypothetical protein